MLEIRCTLEQRWGAVNTRSILPGNWWLQNNSGAFSRGTLTALAPTPRQVLLARLYNGIKSSDHFSGEQAATLCTLRIEYCISSMDWCTVHRRSAVIWSESRKWHPTLFKEQDLYSTRVSPRTFGEHVGHLISIQCKFWVALELFSGSCVLRIASDYTMVSSQIDAQDFVPVASNCEDLRDQIEWCQKTINAELLLPRAN